MTALAAPRQLTSLVGLEPIGLAEVTLLADLQTRVDRKYLVGADVVDRLAVAVLGGAEVLTIEGRTAFTYESVYFDTPDLQAYRDAAHQRRRRYKVRTRTYVDSGQCVLEVKTRSGRGETVKERTEHDVDARSALDGAARRFAGMVLGADAPVEDLVPTLTTRYRRTTVVDRVAPMRMTVDADLVCESPAGVVALDGLVVVETKSAGRPTPADRWLWAAGHRPVSISKYCVGLAALDPALPANRWTRTLARVR